MVTSTSAVDTPSWSVRPRHTLGSPPKRVERATASLPTCLPLLRYLGCQGSGLIGGALTWFARTTLPSDSRLPVPGVMGGKRVPFWS
jgi:hypothetical protein